MHAFSRSELLLSTKGIETLKKKHIAIFGLGGVGSYIVETLARSGIEHFTLIDNDIITISKLNRQLYALTSTMNKKKIEVAKNRTLDINPNCQIQIYDTFVSEDTIDNFDFEKFDYIIDAIDTISAKILLIEKAKYYNIPIISSMGTGNKLDPSQFKITDINQTKICPLARVMRYELKKKNITNVKVLYSTEQPLNLSHSALEQKLLQQENTNKHQIPGSVAFVPSVAGILIAREVIFDLLLKSNITLALNKTN